MKIVRAALIILIVFIIAESIGIYKNHWIAQKERQELLNTFNNDLKEKGDLLKDDLSRLKGQGDIYVSPKPLHSEIGENNQEVAIGEEDTKQGKNYSVIGRIKIDKIDIDYPVLDKTTQETLNISITLFYGRGINQPGNVILAGHNYKNGQLFGRLKELRQGDKFELYNAAGQMNQYKVYKTYLVEPTDLEPLSQNTDGKKIVTLITCANHSKQRLIVKAECI